MTFVVWVGDDGYISELDVSSLPGRELPGLSLDAYQNFQDDRGGLVVPEFCRTPTKSLNMTTAAISKNHELRKRVMLELVLALLGRVSKSIRGVTLHFDGETIILLVYLEGEPSESDVQNMQDVEAELVSHHEYRSELIFIGTTVSESLIGKEGNWGWVFLRSEV